MFGNNANHLAHMVGKRQWDKINNSLHSADAKSKIALAAACAESSDEEAPMVLVHLLKDSDEGVVLQAVKALGAIGSDNSKTHLQWLSNTPAGQKKEIKDAIAEALSQISKRK